MAQTGFSGGTERGENQQRFRQVGFSECGGWPYLRGGHIKGSFIQDNI